MNKKICPLLFFFWLSLAVHAQDSLLHSSAVRITSPPKIDGVLDDDAWKNVPIASDFTQIDPDNKTKPTQRTEVKVVYDDEAIYIGAFMYDTHPDSILHELGSRDDGGLNSDYFITIIDTYNKLIDGYIFAVSASGVQVDGRLQDDTYNAVWASEVKINDKGWVAEYKIPYSAIRFPDSKNQNWRIEFHRNIRRRRELDRWPYIPKDAPNIIKYFGKLDSVSNIKSPLRLSLTPYVSTYAENSPEYNADGTYSIGNSLSYSAGADIKYGIDERFTLDMTLLPDFGQVQSDKKVKNLSYREVQYGENRQFFKEGTELFSKNNLFYTRRIGKTPTLFLLVPDLIKSGETIESNPTQTKLLNATKISGRTNEGLGIGFFNAVTDNTYAVIRDSIGNKRKILTEPLSNYNILVLDQQLKHSSSVYLINTNVSRDKGWGDANVTGTGFQLFNKKNTIKFSGDGAVSQRYGHGQIDSSANRNYDSTGYKYYLGLEKTGGNYTYGIKHEGLSKTFNQLDMGYYAVNNIRNTSSYLTYDQYVVGKYFRSSELSLSGVYSDNFSNAMRTQMEIDVNAYAMLKRYLAIFGGGGVSPYKNADFNEPRVPGLFYITRRFYYAYAGISTDYRKKFAVDLKSNIAQFINEHIQGNYYEADLGLRFRISDKISVFYNGTISHDQYNEGFANFDSLGNPIIGGRVLNTVENRLQARYIFNANMNISLNARHYWNTGRYIKYFNLQSDGTIAQTTNYTFNNDFNYNAFTIDLIYTWIFSPGSQFSIAYKNVIETNNYITAIPRFDDNFSSTIQSPQTNSLSFKFLYYLDYQSVKRKKRQ